MIEKEPRSGSSLKTPSHTESVTGEWFDRIRGGTRSKLARWFLGAAIAHGTVFATTALIQSSNSDISHEEVPPQPPEEPPKPLKSFGEEFLEARPALIQRLSEEEQKRVNARNKSREKNRDPEAVKEFKKELRRDITEGKRVSYRDFAKKKNQIDVGVEPDIIEKGEAYFEEQVEALKADRPNLTEVKYLERIRQLIDDDKTPDGRVKAEPDKTCTSVYDYMASQSDTDKDAGSICGNCISREDKVLMILEAVSPQDMDRVDVQEEGDHKRVLYRLENGNKVRIDPGRITLLTNENKAGTYIYPYTRIIREYAGLPVKPLTIEPGAYMSGEDIPVVNDYNGLKEKDDAKLRSEGGPGQLLTGWNEAVAEHREDYESRRREYEREQAEYERLKKAYEEYQRRHPKAQRFVNIWQTPIEATQPFEVIIDDSYYVQEAEGMYKKAKSNQAKEEVNTLDARNIQNPSLDVIQALQGKQNKYNNDAVNPEEIPRLERLDNIVFGDTNSFSAEAIDAISKIDAFHTVTFEFDADSIPSALIKNSADTINEEPVKGKTVTNASNEGNDGWKYIFHYKNSNHQLTEKDREALKRLIKETKNLPQVTLSFDKEVEISPEDLSILLDPNSVGFQTENWKGGEKDIILQNVRFAVPVTPDEREKARERYEQVLDNFFHFEGRGMRGLKLDADSFYDFGTKIPSKSNDVTDTHFSSIDYDLEKAWKWEDPFIIGALKGFELRHRIYLTIQSTEPDNENLNLILERLQSGLKHLYRDIYEDLPKKIKKEKSKEAADQLSENLKTYKERYEALCEKIGYHPPVKEASASSPAPTIVHLPGSVWVQTPAGHGQR